MNEPTFEKPWMTRWLRNLQRLPPIEQAYGLALAYYADERGVIDNVTWGEIGEAMGATLRTARSLSKDSVMTASGLLDRQDRIEGGRILMPLLKIKWPK